MKLTISFIIVVGVVCISAGNLPEEMLKLMEEGALMCQPKSGITDGELMNLMDHHPPETREGYCFMACMKKHLGLMSPDNKLNFSKLELMIEAIKQDNPTAFDTMMGIARGCTDETDSSLHECDYVKMLMECIKTKGEQAGVKIPFLS